MDSSLTPEQRTLRARLAVQTSWANTPDPTSRTAKARSAAEGRFEQQARAQHPDATDEQIKRMASHLKKAHFTRLALRSAQSRAAKSKPTAA